MKISIFMVSVLMLLEVMAGLSDLRSTEAGTMLGLHDSHGKLIEAFIFDGHKLRDIDPALFAHGFHAPVSEGRFFVLYFIADGFFPDVKVFRAGKEDLDIGGISIRKKLPEGKGVITGVVYKPVRGGKLSPANGIFHMVHGMKVLAVDIKDEVYSATTDENGVFTLSLEPGAYRLSCENDRKAVEVSVTGGKTVVRNIQKGLVLRD